MMLASVRIVPRRPSSSTRPAGLFRRAVARAFRPSVPVRLPGVAIVLAQQIAAEVSVEIAPNSVDVVRATLRVVVFDEEARPLNAVVMRFAAPCRARPGKGDFTEIRTLECRTALRGERFGHPTEIHLEQP